MKTTHLIITDEQWQALRKEAFEKKVSMSEVLRRIIEDYLQKNPSLDVV